MWVLFYSYPTTLKRDAWALKGTWQIQADKIVAMKAGAAIKLHFVAGEVYAVMGLTDKPITLKLFLNGKTVGVESGKDVANGEVQVDGNQLYDLIHLKHVNDGTLEIIDLQPGLEIYTFTFGN